MKSSKRAYKDEPIVGFIAEDVPDIVTSKEKDSLSAMEIVALLTKVVQVQAEKITKLEVMQKRLVRVESLLTNLALETSGSKKEKISINLK